MNLDPTRPSGLSLERRYGFRAVVRACVSIALLIVLFYTLPLDGFDALSTVLTIVLSPIVLVLVITWQIRSILRSPRPALRALEIVSISIPLFILMSATTYVVMSRSNAQSFSESLTRTDALYFAMTVFSTVGFGDIAPLTQSARIVVTAQIFIDLLTLGVGFWIVVGAVDWAKKRRQPTE